MATGNITVQHDRPQQQGMQRQQQQQPRGDFIRALLSWDPFREMAPAFGGGFNVAFDVKDTPDAFVFQADVPGLKEKDVQIQCLGNRVTVSGKRESEQEKKEETYYTYERSYGSFARTFTLPESADVDKASAELKDGVLTLTIPKKPSEKPRNVQIKGGTPPSAPH